MKPNIAFIALVSCVLVVPGAAKTITSPQGNSNQQAVEGVAGPAAAANNSGGRQARSGHRHKQLSQRQIVPASRGAAAKGNYDMVNPDRAPAAANGNSR